MKSFRIAAIAAALSLASYAQATAQEDLLGRKAQLSGATRAASQPSLPDMPESSGVAVGKALGRLKPEGRANTRGAKETGIYQRAAPAVVLVVAEDAVGSGVLIGADGRIVTNLHVVGDAKEVGVVFKPSMEGAAVGDADVRVAKVIRRDDVADLALLQVEAVPPGVTPLELGNSTTLEVGADVHAIGHPTGEAWTYTRGIVSQIRRAYGWKAGDKVQHEATVIQTQTPINPGNSGGPLIDDNLKVVGINSFKGEGEGMNYAVSAEDVKSFLARTQDRVSQTRQAAAETCKAQAVEEEPYDKPKGTRFLMDTDCDGEGDSVLIVPKSKRDPIVVITDEDGNGDLDTMYFDDNQDGDFETALYDTDGNGKPDLRGDFRNGEDEPYRMEKISEK
ncbi:serine protease [Phenylobacterium sp.]|jgi:S1-C subfamily serine protease|uniref:S1C family serine protease n=1 Tax=Phenylobacterium sp. TaxID=1871053 RepID=UPI002F94F193